MPGKWQSFFGLVRQSDVSSLLRSPLLRRIPVLIPGMPHAACSMRMQQHISLLSRGKNNAGLSGDLPDPKMQKTKPAQKLDLERSAPGIRARGGGGLGGTSTCFGCSALDFMIL